MRDQPTASQEVIAYPAGVQSSPAHRLFRMAFALVMIAFCAWLVVGSEQARSSGLARSFGICAMVQAALVLGWVVAGRRVESTRSYRTALVLRLASAVSIVMLAVAYVMLVLSGEHAGARTRNVSDVCGVLIVLTSITEHWATALRSRTLTTA